MNRTSANDRLRRFIETNNQENEEHQNASTISGRGRGLVNVKTKGCICKRQYSHILCHNCGHLMFGRVKRPCTEHPNTTFLIDITNCPRCKCFDWLLNEITLSL